MLSSSNNEVNNCRRGTIGGDMESSSLMSELLHLIIIGLLKRGLGLL